MRVLQEHPRASVVTALTSERGLVESREPCAVPVADVQHELQCFGIVSLGILVRRRSCSALPRLITHFASSARSSSNRAMSTAARSSAMPRSKVVAVRRQRAGRAERSRAELHRDVGASRTGVDPRLAFGEVAADVPEFPQDVAQSHLQLGAAPLRPAQGGAQVIVLQFESIEPQRLFGAMEPRGRLLGEVDTPRQMPIACGIIFAGAGKLFGSVLAECFELRVARLACGGIGDNKRSLDQPRQHAECVSARVAYGLRGIQAPPPAKTESARNSRCSGSDNSA